MNVSTDAGARQARATPASTSTSSTDSTPKAQIGANSANPNVGSASARNLDTFQAASPKNTLVALNAFAPAPAPAPATPGANPPINVDAQKDAKYGKVDGTPFVQGSGDSNAVQYNDIQQGQLGDCYLMSAMGEVAKQNPQAIQDAIKDNGDGSYTVRFYEKKGDGLFGWFGHHYEPKEIRVTPDLPVDANGNPVFAQTGDANGSNKELWPALIEKAYAQWKGSYDGIGHGGNPGDAMSALTGKDAEEKGASGVTIDQLNDALNSGKGVVANTIDNGKGKAPYDNGQLVADHAYMVTGVDKQAGTVTIHNPWNKDDSGVTLSIADFNKYLGSVDFCATR
jgi:Calpain family cysteine protease